MSVEELKKETKLVRNAGSIRTTVPSAMVDLLELSEGDKLCWELEINKNGSTLTLIPLKQE